MITCTYHTTTYIHTHTRAPTRMRTHKRDGARAHNTGRWWSGERGNRIAEIQWRHSFVFHVGPRVAIRMPGGRGPEGNDWWARWPVFREHRDEYKWRRWPPYEREKIKYFVRRVPVNLNAECLLINTRTHIHVYAHITKTYYTHTRTNGGRGEDVWYLKLYFTRAVKNCIPACACVRVPCRCFVYGLHIYTPGILNLFIARSTPHIGVWS